MKLSGVEKLLAAIAVVFVALVFAVNFISLPFDNTILLEQTPALGLSALSGPAMFISSGGGHSPDFLGSSSHTASQKPAAKININTADARELDALPGIGEVKAQAIVDYREANGPFAAPEELMKVKGIGQATYNKLKDLITID